MSSHSPLRVIVALDKYGFSSDPILSFPLWIIIYFAFIEVSAPLSANKIVPSTKIDTNYGVIISTIKI